MTRPRFLLNFGTILSNTYLPTKLRMGVDIGLPVYDCTSSYNKFVEFYFLGVTNLN